MDLSLQKPGDHHFIRSVGDKGIQVGDTFYQRSLLVSADTLLPDWQVVRLDQLSPGTLQPLFELNPDVVLLGTGRTQQFPAPELMMLFYQRGVGIEVMSTEAACRTFNVLVSEARRVVAALLPLDGVNP